LSFSSAAPLLRLEVVQPRVVPAENRGLDRTVGRTERLERVFLFARSSGISRRRSASICHCGDPVQIASVPQHTWSAPIPLITVRSSRRYARIRDRRLREQLADIGVDIRHTVFRRNFGKVRVHSMRAGRFDWFQASRLFPPRRIDSRP